MNELECIFLDAELQTENSKLEKLREEQSQDENLQLELEENNKWTASDELDQIPLGTAEEERLRAKAWMDTAAFHCRNEEYLNKERNKALITNQNLVRYIEWLKYEFNITSNDLAEHVSETPEQLENLYKKDNIFEMLDAEFYAELVRVIKHE